MINQLSINDPEKNRPATQSSRVELEVWEAQSFMMGGGLIMFKELDPGYIWIYFLYAPTSREFKAIADEFLKRHYGIIEFRTNKPSLFKNHAIHIKNDMYRWIRD